jgi:hypothetical protein
VKEEMRRQRCKKLGGAAAALAGLFVAVTFATSSERLADAGSAAASEPSDSGIPSSFVMHAQRGEVIPPGLGDVEHMCALLTSCGNLPMPPSLIPPDFKTCVTKMADEMTSPTAVNLSLMMRECGLQSNSCANLRACVLRGANPDVCSGRGKQGVVGFCDGDGRALSCWHEQVLSVRDCPRGGEQCLVVDGRATCALGPCPGSIKEADPPRCSASGTHVLKCEKGKLASLDCAAFGLKCATDADGIAACATGGPLCSVASKRCEGPVAVGCVNGHEVRVDCASAGLACSTSDAGTLVGACVEPQASSACDPDVKAKCSGPSIEYCFAGKNRSYFCKALGFSRCEAGPSGAHCVP